MAEKLFRITNYIAGLLPIGALFGLMAFVANVEIRDLDLWLHLAVGRFITISQTVPSADILSHTMTGQFWNNHEWLFQVLLYNVFHLYGIQGIANMQIVVVTVTLLGLLFIGYNRNRQFFVALVLIMVYMVYQTRFTIRPDLFSLLFFTIYMFIMSLHIDKRWSIFALFIVQVLWTNMHGFFFFGPLFALIGIVSELIKRHVPLPMEWNEAGRLNDEEFGRFIKLFVFTCLACFINPQGIHGAIYPISVFFSLSGEDQIFFKYIQELQPTVAHWRDLFDTRNFAFYKMLIFASGLTFYFNRRRIDISALFLWIIFLIFSLKAVRNVSFFAFAAYLVIITNCYSLTMNDIFPISFKDKKFIYITGTVAKLLLVLWIMDVCAQMAPRAYYDFDTYQNKSEFGGVSQRTYPNKAVDFIVENNIKGNFFNDFNSGAYLIGRAFPNVKVFIDGRTELYGGKFFKEKYLEVWKHGNGEVFEEIVAKYNVTGALLNSSKEVIPPDILKYISSRPEWVPVYFDYDGLIFLKDVPENQSHIERFRIDLANWKPPRADLYRYSTARIEPYRYNNRAFTLETMGFEEPALAEASEALKITPGYSDPHELIGKIYARRKEFQKAYEEFRHAALIDPGDKKNRYNVALSLMDMNEYERAIQEYENIRKQWPGDPKAIFFLAKAFAFNRQFEKSKEYFDQAVKSSPKNVIDVLIIGDAVFEKQRYPLALEMYEQALGKEEDQDKVHYKLSLTHHAQGNLELAIEHATKALELQTENEEYIKHLQELTAQEI